jgi:hypothetical protein
MSVKLRAEYIGTFRWLEVYLMETIAGWIASIPEMEAKILLGRHVWQCAQNADSLGKRAFELRKPLHYSVAPSIEYEAFLERSRSIETAPDRLAIFYKSVLPGLIDKYRTYLAWTNPLMDEPSVIGIENNLARIDQMIGEFNAFAVLPNHEMFLKSVPDEKDTYENFLSQISQNEAKPNIVKS